MHRERERKMEREQDGKSGKAEIVVKWKDGKRGKMERRKER